MNWLCFSSFPRRREPMTTDVAIYAWTVVMGPRLRGDDTENAVIR
jgi:hypothetical protein